MDRLPQDRSTLLFSIINIIIHHSWLSCRNERSLIESRQALAQCAPFYCARHDGFGERLCNHWLNYFTKQRNLSEISFPYKEYLSAAIEIKNCSGISKPLVLLIQRTNSFFSVLFSSGWMLVFSTTIIFYIRLADFALNCLSNRKRFPWFHSLL